VAPAPSEPSFPPAEPTEVTEPVELRPSRSCAGPGSAARVCARARGRAIARAGTDALARPQSPFPNRSTSARRPASPRNNRSRSRPSPSTCRPPSPNRLRLPSRGADPRNPWSCARRSLSRFKKQKPVVPEPFDLPGSHEPEPEQPPAAGLDDRDELIESLRARVEAQELELAKLREQLEQERTRKDVQVHVWPEEQPVPTTPGRSRPSTTAVRADGRGLRAARPRRRATERRPGCRGARGRRTVHRSRRSFDCPATGVLAHTFSGRSPRDHRRRFSTPARG
jgi:hypothetical protein